MDRFNLYAKYYDLLYEDKDYKSEVSYIEQLIEPYGFKKPIEILELGCGTGNHAKLFSEKGYSVEGVDLSSQMIEIAKHKNKGDDNLSFYEGDINSYRSDKKFDVVTSLFHVVSYQNTNEKLEETFKTAAHHLKTGGLFIFDFWYGPGVLTDPPVVREKKLENDAILVNRKATPESDGVQNVIKVLFDIAIKDKSTDKEELIKETHVMRYLFIPELKYMLDKNGLDTQDYYHWMTFEKPTNSSWNVVVVAKKR
ncbi:MAG: class I SAM-dependent methyltransferase [Winogradskyella sp.]|uniref:class I SAM-dependent DNA methyltransferase n=1 Tax=Winogradskyella sp. TaxID=1883156 RepID=UPI0025E35C47|nr:class I SAM-dependent methyltransferase [Winogradskyella sp.]NRB59420.1 class I SAM-dependent methyltransferase [Winogradskyella sp.]